MAPEPWNLRLLRAWDRASSRVRVGISSLSPFNQPLRTDTIVSLTTYPARIGTVHRTLISLLAQKNPAPVHLYLSQRNFPDRGENITPQIRALVGAASDRLFVHWVTEDHRSYKKLIPAVTEFAGKVIVTADDDVIYKADWLETLAGAHRRTPHAVVGTRGNSMVFTDQGVLLPYSSWPEAPANEPSFRTFLTGRGGILYPPGSLAEPVTDLSLAARLAPTADDVWFKAASLRAGFPSLRVPIPRDYPASGATQNEGLFRTNVDESENDRAIARVFAHFEIQGTAIVEMTDLFKEQEDG